MVNIYQGPFYEFCKGHIENMLKKNCFPTNLVDKCIKNVLNKQ